MSRICLVRFLLPVCFAPFTLLAQPATGAPKPQTARQALIEMVSQGPNAIEKHLSPDVQKLLRASPENHVLVTTVAGVSFGSGLKTFETGDILFTYPAAQKIKYE